MKNKGKSVKPLLLGSNLITFSVPETYLSHKAWKWPVFFGTRYQKCWKKKKFERDRLVSVQDRVTWYWWEHITTTAKDEKSNCAIIITVT